MWKIHRESENAKLVQVRNFWVKGYSTGGERDTIFQCWLVLHPQLSTQPTRGARSAQSRLASPRTECRLSRSEARTQLTAFLKSQNPHPTLPDMTSFTSLVPFPIWEFYFDISECHILSARVWTPALMLHLTNPCAKRKVLILTKLKCKIYKTKSLRHYITISAPFLVCGLHGFPKGIKFRQLFKTLLSIQRSAVISMVSFLLWIF